MSTSTSSTAVTATASASGLRRLATSSSSAGDTRDKDAIRERDAVAIPKNNRRMQDHLFKRVHVESHNATFEGVLLAFDNHFNILLKDAEQIRTIVKTVKDEEGGEKKTETVFERRSLGVIEIRGMWVTSITVIGEGEAKDRKEKAMAKIKGSVGGSGSGGLGGDSAGGGLAAMAEQYEAGRSQRRVVTRNAPRDASRRDSSRDASRRDGSGGASRTAHRYGYKDSSKRDDSRNESRNSSRTSSRNASSRPSPSPMEVEKHDRVK